MKHDKEKKIRKEKMKKTDHDQSRITEKLLFLSKEYPGVWEWHLVIMTHKG